MSQAETLDDLYDWKTALEEALSSAPSAALFMGQNGIFRNDQGNVSPDQGEFLFYCFFFSFLLYLYVLFITHSSYSQVL